METGEREEKGGGLWPYMGGAPITPESLTRESPSLVLVINDTKLLMPCVKCFELGISNTCDEGVCGKEVVAIRS
jgi:hypothetical protein